MAERTKQRWERARTIEPVYRRIGREVRQARGAYGLTQEKLGARIGLSRISMMGIENAQQRIQVHTLFDIARTLGVPVELLLRTRRNEAPTLVEKIDAAICGIYVRLCRVRKLDGAERLQRLRLLSEASELLSDAVEAATTQPDVMANSETAALRAEAVRALADDISAECEKAQPEGERP